MSEPTRRTFLALAGVAVALPVLRIGETPAAGQAPKAGGWVATLPPAELKNGQVTRRWAASHKFLLSRSGDTFYALNTRCTHKGCSVSLDSQGIVCPCHEARYSLTGAVTEKPAKKNLARHPVRLGNDGRIEVDTSRQLPADDAGGTLVVEPIKEEA